MSSNVDTFITNAIIKALAKALDNQEFESGKHTYRDVCNRNRMEYVSFGKHDPVHHEIVMDSLNRIADFEETSSSSTNWLFLWNVALNAIRLGLTREQFLTVLNKFDSDWIEQVGTHRHGGLPFKYTVDFITTLIEDHGSDFEDVDIEEEEEEEEGEEEEEEEDKESAVEE